MPDGGTGPATHASAPSDSEPFLAEVDLGTLDLQTPPFEEGPARRVERTRALLAYLLLALLAGVIATLLALLSVNKLTTEQFGTVAGVLIAPIVGLLGAATGYYYSRDR